MGENQLVANMNVIEVNDVEVEFWFVIKYTWPEWVVQELIDMVKVNRKPASVVVWIVLRVYIGVVN